MTHSFDQVLLTLALILPIASQFSAQTPKRATPTRQEVPGAAAEMRKRGEAKFYEHCPLCHLGRSDRTKKSPFTGPNLKNLFKNAKPAKEAAVRKQILKGSENMPGYEHTLKPADMDDLIAFLKNYE